MSSKGDGKSSKGKEPLGAGSGGSCKLSGVGDSMKRKTTQTAGGLARGDAKQPIRLESDSDSVINLESDEDDWADDY